MNIAAFDIIQASLATILTYRNISKQGQLSLKNYSSFIWTNLLYSQIFYSDVQLSEKYKRPQIHFICGWLFFLLFEHLITTIHETKFDEVNKAG